MGERTKLKERQGWEKDTERETGGKGKYRKRDSHRERETGVG